MLGGWRRMNLGGLLCAWRRWQQVVVARHERACEDDKPAGKIGTELDDVVGRGIPCREDGRRSRIYLIRRHLVIRRRWGWVDGHRFGGEKRSVRWMCDVWHQQTRRRSLCRLVGFAE